MSENYAMELLSIGNNAKTIKSDKGGEWLTAIMYMLPTLATCPASDLAQCRTACLNTAGRGAMSNVQQARQRKTERYLHDPQAYVDVLAADILKAQRKAAKKGVKLAVRLNGTSDIPWENITGSNNTTLLEMFPEVQFYDYTKLPTRKVPENYHLTVSYSGANAKYAAKVLDTSHNIAVVFRDELPIVFAERQVIDGDRDDLRFLDPKGVVVGLKAKGKAKKDRTGFVINL